MPDPAIHGPMPGPLRPSNVGHQNPEANRLQPITSIHDVVRNIAAFPHLELEELPNLHRDVPEGIIDNPYAIRAKLGGIARAETRDESSGRVSQQIGPIITSGSELFGLIEVAKWHPGDQNPVRGLGEHELSVPQPGESGYDSYGGYEPPFAALVRYRKGEKHEIVDIVEARNRGRRKITVDGQTRAAQLYDPDTRFSLEQNAYDYDYVIVTGSITPIPTRVIALRSLHPDEISRTPTIVHAEYPDNDLTEHSDFWVLSKQNLQTVYELREQRLQAEINVSDLLGRSRDL